MSIEWFNTRLSVEWFNTGFYKCFIFIHVIWICINTYKFIHNITSVLKKKNSLQWFQIRVEIIRIHNYFTTCFDVCCVQDGLLLDWFDGCCVQDGLLLDWFDGCCVQDGLLFDIFDGCCVQYGLLLDWFDGCCVQDGLLLDWFDGCFVQDGFLIDWFDGCFVQDGFLIDWFDGCFVQDGSDGLTRMNGAQVRRLMNLNFTDVSGSPDGQYTRYTTYLIVLMVSIPDIQYINSPDGHYTRYLGIVRRQKRILKSTRL